MSAKTSFPILQRWTVGIAVAINLLLVFLVGKLCAPLGLSVDKSGFLVSVHEAVCGIAASLFLVLTLRKSEHPPLWIKILVVSFFSVALGDLFYGLDYYLLGHVFKKTLLILTHEVPYIVFMGSLALASFLRARDGLTPNQTKWISRLMLVLAAAYFVCSYRMVLSFQFPAGYDRPTINLFTSYIYGILQAIAVGALLVSSVRTRGMVEFCLWFLFLTLNGSDFALRYQDVGKHSLGTPIFEYGWALGISMLSCSSVWIYLRSEVELLALHRSPASLNSIRVLAPALMLAALTLFAGINITLSPYLQIADVGTLTGHTLVFVFVWVAANASGVYLSRVLFQRVQALSESISSTASLETLGRAQQGLVELDPVVDALTDMKTRLNASLEEASKAKATAAVGVVASQVAHDIRSPLAALEMITGDLSGIPEDRRVIVRSAVGRIKDIANGLLQKNRAVGHGGGTGNSQNSGEEALSTQLLSALIDGLITEKRTQYRSRIGIDIDVELGGSAYGIFVKIQPTELKRVLSNLINNSVEAFDSSGKVSVSLDGDDTYAKLIVRDNGKGIPPEVLPKLMQRGVSHGKDGGSGLGLYHARTSCEAWGGSLEVGSHIGHGTSVIITLPRAPAPHWFVPKLVLTPQSTVVVLDDDTSIHQIWQDRFEHARVAETGIRVLHFSTPNELEAWLAEPSDSAERRVFLFDFELIGEKTNGLALIEKLGIAKQSILVTSRYEEQTIRENCRRLGVRLIPKGMAGFVPITMGESGLPFDAVLIDDDELVHMSWRLSAKQTGSRFVGFKTAEEFLAVADQFDRATPIYIDSFLGKSACGEEVRGEETSLQLSKMGFRELYLATGLAPHNADQMNWLRGVREKDAPFSELSFRPKAQAPAEV